MKKYICPECNAPFPILKHLFNFRWKWLCPFCKTQIQLTARSSQQVGAIAGLTFGLIIIVAGKEFKLNSLFFGAFLIFAYFYGRILAYFLGKLEKSTKTKSLNFFPNQSGFFKWCTIIGLVGNFVILPVLSFFVKDIEGLPIWITSALIFIFLVSSICLFLGAGNMMFGKQGVFRKLKKIE